MDPGSPFVVTVSVRESPESDAENWMLVDDFKTFFVYLAAGHHIRVIAKNFGNELSVRLIIIEIFEIDETAIIFCQFVGACNCLRNIQIIFARNRDFLFASGVGSSSIENIEFRKMAKIDCSQRN